MAGKKSGKGGVNIPVSTDAKEAKNEIKSLNEEVKTVEKNTKNLSKTTKKALDDFTKDIKKLNAAFASGKKVITKEGFLDKRFLNKNLRSPEGLKKLSQSEGLAPELYIATLKEINKELSENSQKQKQITNQIKERRDIEVAANKQKKEDTLALKKVELEYWTQARIAVLDKQKANQIEKEQRAQARKEADRQRREEEKRAKEEAKAAEIEANRFITDKKLYQVTDDLSGSTETYKKALGVVLTTTTNIISKNRKLSFTQELFNGIRSSFGKMIGYTKIMSSSIGLVSSAFGFLIDMIFLPLLPLVLAIAEGLFTLGEVANGFLEFIQGIPLIGESFAVILSFAGLLAIAFGMFLTGALLSDVLGVAGGFKKIYDILKDISIMEGISSVLSMLGFGGGGSDKGGSEGGGGGYYYSKDKDKNKSKKPSKTKTPSKAGNILSKLKSVIPAAAGAVGSLASDLALPLAAGVGIVTAMNQLGVGQALSDFGESSGIQYNLRAMSKDWNINEHMYGAVGDLINVSTGFVTDTLNSVFGLSLEKFAAATPNMVEEALREGKYNQAVIKAINQKLGEGTIGYMGEEYAESIGKEAGYYLLNRKGEAYGERMTSYSNVLSNTSNYNTYYQNTNGNGAFNLQNTAGL